MIFKSQQVNLDPEPYVDQHGSTRSPDGDPAGHDFDVHFEYEPRPEFEPTRDPVPWWNRNEPIQTGNYARSSEQLPGYVWAPRREEFDTPVNRVLSNLRLMRQGPIGEQETLAQTAQWVLDQESDWDSSPQFEHAYRVLTRLARL